MLEIRGDALVGVGTGWLALELPRLAATTLPACTPAATGGGDNAEGMRRVPAAPDAVDGRLYAKAAAALDAGRRDAAEADFVAILQLPPDQRQGFGVAAAYMLGRLAPPHGDTWFAQARDLARAGGADPLCLAHESLGEQGRQALVRGDDGAAVRAYAEQAATGESGAVNSLAMVGHALADDPGRMVVALDEPLVQGLLAAMAHASGEAWTISDHGGVYRDRLGHNEQLLWAMATRPLQRGQDRLAAAAWRAGEFELAEWYAGQSERALAQVVRAKAAIRNGDSGALGTRLEAAARAAADEGDLRLLGQIEQDRAVLALSEGRYQEAGARAVALGDVGLVVYIVERVLAPDEALALLAQPEVRSRMSRAPLPYEAAWDRREKLLARAPATATATVTARGAVRGQRSGPQPREADRRRALFDDAVESLHGDEGWDQPTLDQLQRVIGRRLARMGQGEAAARLLPPAEAARARVYGAALAEARGKRGVDRAVALDRAARALLPDGIDLLGTELGPDWAMVEGAYTDALEVFDRAVPEAEFPATEPTDDPTCQQRRGERGPAASICVVSADEARRVAASAPPGRSGTFRYHYRARAAELSLEAAASVPTHTQAFGALLCAAYQPVRDRVPDWPARPYATYVRHGAFVAGLFDGRRCPAPDFARARSTPAPSWQWQLRRRLRWWVRDAIDGTGSAWDGAGQAADLGWIGDAGAWIREELRYEWSNWSQQFDDE